MRFSPRETPYFRPEKVLGPLEQTEICADEFIMQERSFRSILADFLEGNAVNLELEPPPTTSSPGPQMAFFQWQSPTPKVVKANPYPRPPRRPPPPKIEVLIPTCDLSEAAKVDVELLIQMGATLLKSGISPNQLKKAHRLLVKSWHPDRVERNLTERGRQERHEGFLALQAAYERLIPVIETLSKGKLSDSACGNGSASAQGYRPPAAA